MSAVPENGLGENGLGEQEDGPLQRAARLVAAAGAYARPIREIIALLAEGPHPLASLVRTSGVSRRGVEDVLQALADDLEHDERGMRLRREVTPAYRQRFGYGRARPADPLAAEVRERAALAAEIEGWITAAPRARRDLDHVAATQETVLRRALWLDANYDLAGAHLLCVGDHDLTSLAVCRVNPDVTVTVVDLDERILEFIGAQARRHGLNVRCRYADLRFGLPASCRESADLLFTDPPYTPEGVQLFLARGLAGLRDRELSRLVLAYGFGERQPTLGLKVQQAIQELHLVFEAILPRFNRYTGAQAVGSASELYVCRPTTRTWKALDDSGRGKTPNIYTHGARSLEGDDSPLSGETAAALCAAAVDDTAGDSDIAVVADSWNFPIDVVGHARLATVFACGLPPAIARRNSLGVAVDLSADPGPWLLRALLAINAERIALLVPDDHPALARPDALTELLAPKYRLRFHRGTPSSGYAIVRADSATELAESTETADSGTMLRRWLLDRAHGKTGNVLREGLVRISGGVISKNEARATIRERVARADTLDTALIELPRAEIRALLATPFA